MPTPNNTPTQACRGPSSRCASCNVCVLPGTHWQPPLKPQLPAAAGSQWHSVFNRHNSLRPPSSHSDGCTVHAMTASHGQTASHGRTDSAALPSALDGFVLQLVCQGLAREELCDILHSRGPDVGQGFVCEEGRVGSDQHLQQNRYRNWSWSLSKLYFLSVFNVPATAVRTAHIHVAC